jgi:formylglycine-generating enzyme required for sulfatase activity
MITVINEIALKSCGIMGTTLLMIAVQGCFESTTGESPNRKEDTSGDKETSTNSDEKTDTVSDPGIEWITIKGGTFVMGSPPDEYDRKLNERAHTVTLTHDFEIAATEVTVSQWTALGFDEPAGNVNECEEDNCPAYGLHQQLILDWLDTLSKRNGLEPCGQSDGNPYACTGYRLPTEAEWEYAARGGTTAATYNGDLSEETAGGVLASIAVCGDHDYIPLPAASRSPNAFGLYDMLGNLYEAAEWAGIYPEGPVTNPYYAPRSEHFLTLRGGYRGGDLAQCRAAFRSSFVGSLDNIDNAQDYTIAFRPVRTLPGSDVTEATVITESACFEATTYACADFGTEVSLEILSSCVVDPSSTFHAMAVERPKSIRPMLGILGTSKRTEGNSVFLLAVEPEKSDNPLKPTVVKTFTLSSLESEATDLQPIALDTREKEDKNEFVALVCGEGCFLATSTASADAASPLGKTVGSDLPEGLAPRDMVIAQDDIFVAGNGIAKFSDNEWTVLIGPGTGGQFNKITKIEEDERVTLTAVGDGGRIAMGNLETWSEIQSGVTENLYDVMIYSGFGEDSVFAAVGQDGIIIEGTASSLTSCKGFAEDLMHLSYNPDIHAQIYLSGGTDQIFAPNPYSGIPPCLGDAPSAPVIGFSIYRCGEAYNPLYLTRTGLYGKWRCVFPI